MIDMREMERVEAPVGEPVRIMVGCSEAAMATRLCGRELLVTVDERGLAVIDVGHATLTITPGEAGLYRDETGWYGYRKI